MVIVKSKIDFATSMRRIFQSMAGKIFDFQCKRQRKVVKNFHCNQYISFCRKKEEDCEKRTVWKTKGKFSSFQEMGLPGRLWISDASYQSFLPARSIQGSFFCSEIIAKEPLDLHFSSLSECCCAGQDALLGYFTRNAAYGKAIHARRLPNEDPAIKASYNNGLIKIPRF